MNAAAYRGRAAARRYRGGQLRPAERVVLVRHRVALSGRVLELGCGGGRVTAALVEIASAVEAIDASAAMVEGCQRAVPRAACGVADMRDLRAFGDATFDAVVGAFNVLDTVSAADRHRVLAEVHRVLRPGGALVFSSHNRDDRFAGAGPMPRWRGSLLRYGWGWAMLPRRAANRRRFGRQGYAHVDHAILNDCTHHYRALHYYVGRDDQERQLAAAGFALVECLDDAGAVVGPGERHATAPDLHYVATRCPVGVAGQNERPTGIAEGASGLRGSPACGVGAL